MGVVAAIGGAIASLVTGVVSTISQSQEQARMASYNALLARQNADLALRKRELQKIQTRIMEKKHREKVRRYLGTQRALYGKAGVTMEGTPLLTLAETAAEAELDALAIRYAGSVEEANILAEAAGYRQAEHLAGMRGRAARMAGYLGAGSELLTGISQFAQLYPKEE